MRAFLAVSAADRISRTAIAVAGVLCGVLVFFVAIPLALSSPFPSPKEGSWVIHRSELHVASPITLPIATDLPSGLAHGGAAAAWNFVSLPAYSGPSLFEPANGAEDVTASIAGAGKRNTDTSTAEKPEEPRWQLASLPSDARVAEPGSQRASGTRSSDASHWPFVLPGSAASLNAKPDPRSDTTAAPPKHDTAGTIEEVNDYLWEVYQRTPAKKDGAGDFTWKDPTAAKRMGMSMPTYVIGGMDPDFREQLYQAGHAMDDAGVHWSILSAFRDDYRQSIASGIKAASSYSMHGGKARTGGYGHGQAVDITNAAGNDETVWRWVDRNGAKYGLFRPMPGYDPAHVQPREAWHKLAATFRASRVALAARQNAAAAKSAAAEGAKREATAQ